jgi:IS4 transposase
VLADRAFAYESVKDTCDDHDVYYLTPGIMRASEKATCTRLRRQNKLVDIQPASPSDTDNDSPTRKEVYVPAMNADWTGDEVDDDDGDTDENQSESKEPDGNTREFLENLSLTESRDDEENPKRRELLEEFNDLTGAKFEEDGSLADLLEDIREEEANKKTRGSEEDAKLYALFETNHPDIEIPDEEETGLSEEEKIHMVSRVVRMYGDRWGIENGFKQIKSFRIRTTSMNHEYRFFNFLFACTLYNLWRLTDILVKLELGAEYKYRQKPLVTADLFLTIAKDEGIGLDPPD